MLLGVCILLIGEWQPQQCIGLCFFDFAAFYIKILRLEFRSAEMFLNKAIDYIFS